MPVPYSFSQKEYAPGDYQALPGGGYVTSYNDITDYKHAEKALLEANETLEQRDVVGLGDQRAEAAHIVPAIGRATKRHLG